MSSTSTVAIAGISSRLALDTTAALLRRPNIHVRGTCRDINKLPASLREHPRVSLIQTGPYEEEKLRELVQGANVVICCYFADNETMFKAQKLLIDLSEDEGVPRYVASDYTTNYSKVGLGDIPLKDPMIRIKAYLEEKPSIKAVHVLVGLLVDIFFDMFDLWDPKERKLRYWGTGQEKWEFTTYRTTAEYLAAVALDSNAVGILRFLGDRKSVFEIAELIESVYGIHVESDRLGSLEDRYNQRESNNDLQVLVSSVTYFMLNGTITIGDALNNDRYPEIRPESLRDFFERDNILCDSQ